MVQTNQQGFPQASAPFVDTITGQLTIASSRFLYALWLRTGGGAGSSPPPIAVVPVGSSPFTYQAPSTGHAFIAPGTYCNVSIIRGGVTLNYGYVTRGIFPLSVGDYLVVTYTTLTPVISFL